MYSEETRVEKDTCIPLFIEVLFTIARTWKQPRCPSTDGWIKKLWNLYTMEYYPAIKRNTSESVLMRFSSVLSLSRVRLEVGEPKTYYIVGSELERES